MTFVIIRWNCLLAELVFVIACLCFVSSAAALHIAYRVSMPDPASHYFHVEMALTDVDRESVDVQLPAWTPGHYLLLNHARNVRGLKAVANAATLPVKKTDKQTWRIDTAGTAEMILQYRVYNHNLTGDYSFLDSTQAFINGASLFMYVVGEKSRPVTLDVKAPDGWDIVSSTGNREQTRYAFANYDLLIDELFQLGSFTVETFSIANTTYRVCVVTERDRELIPAFAEKVRVLQETAVRLFGPLDTPRYTFFFHFLPNSPDSAGMEHLHGCQLTRQHRLQEGGVNMEWTLWITAHELAHAWNVKRLRPQKLGPFDYTKEVPSPYIWFAEGGTNYLADLVMLRSGLWDRQTFLDFLAMEITKFRRSPAIYERSPEQASFDFWLYPFSEYRESDWWHLWMSPYTSGELICMSMDLRVRHMTDNRIRFEDFFRAFYERMYIEAEAETYYLPGRGYARDELVNLLQELTSADWNGFYHDHIATAGDIPFENYLQFVGLQLAQTEEDPTPFALFRLFSPLVDYPQDLRDVSTRMQNPPAARKALIPSGLHFHIIEMEEASPEQVQRREDWLQSGEPATSVNWKEFIPR